MVTVRLVENSLKSRDGMVIVVILIVKYRTVDVNCKIKRMLLAKRPNHEAGPCASTTSLARVTAEDSAPVPTMVGIVCIEFESASPKVGDGLADAMSKRMRSQRVSVGRVKGA